MLRKIRKGQSTIEFVLLITIVLGAFVALNLYLKRGFQGRWKEAVDQMGDQYDPRKANTAIMHTSNATTHTVIKQVEHEDGFYTERSDSTTSTTTKTGTMDLGEY